MKYFTFTEFERSVTAALKGYDNEAPREARRNIEYLVDTVMDPLREFLGCPVIITSGYRCRDLNHDVGGSPTSQHLLGLAADFVPNGCTQEACDSIRRWFRLQQTRHTEAQDAAWDTSIPFDQLIDYGTFFHVGLRPEGSANRYQMLRYNAFGQGYRRD
jgi:hypothetical protein